MRDITSSRLLVTGAAGGIAGSIITAFDRAGATLALADVDEDAVHTRASESGAIALAADLTDPDEIAYGLVAAARSGPRGQIRELPVFPSG